MEREREEAEAEYRPVTNTHMTLGWEEAECRIVYIYATAQYLVSSHARGHDTSVV